MSIAHQVLARFALAFVLPAAAPLAVAEPHSTADSQPMASSSTSKVTSTEQVVIAELFTSQGCSSCPSADEVASQLDLGPKAQPSSPRPIAEQRDADRPLAVIAWHVDYWDRLGWKDPFSSPFATDRQYADSSRRRSRNVYTPQLIVHGGSEFVGSDRPRAVREIASAKSSQPRKADLLLHVRPPSPPVETGVTSGSKDAPTSSPQTASASRQAPTNGLLQVELDIVPRDGQIITECEVVVVLTESGLTTNVSRGENAGRKLVNDHVARSWTNAVIPTLSKPQPALSVMIQFSQDIKPSNASIVAFLQDRSTGAIVAAARAPLATPPLPHSMP